MKIALSTFIGLMACQLACSPRSETSKGQMSPEARLVLGGARDVEPHVLDAIDEARLRQDWLYQRELAWQLWSDLTKIPPGSAFPHQKWESWYAKEDLQSIFRDLYTKLGRDGRKQRRAFTDEAIEAALAWNDVGQFQDPSWNKRRFEIWLKKFDSASKQRSMPGMNRILMNRRAMVAIMQQYGTLLACAKSGAGDPCSDFRMPKHAAFLKTAWRRGEGGFTLPYFSDLQNPIAQQMPNVGWKELGRWTPIGNESYAIESSSGQIFHLAAVHLSLKLEGSWFWQSLWLDKEAASDLGGDRPTDVSDTWSHYKLCAVNGHELPPVLPENSEGPQPIGVEALPGASWCSNPFLESGDNNHRTNCIGCHQHAGSPWNDAEFRLRLTFDLDHMSRDAGGPPSRSDAVWSLFNGPEPIVAFISQEIETFDIYDLFEPTE